MNLSMLISFILNKILFFILFVPFIAPGIYSIIALKHLREKIKRCTMPVNVGCAEIEYHYYRGDKFVGKEPEWGARAKSWYPIFRGYINGEEVTYKVHACVSGCYVDLEVGDRTEIMVNPENHKEWINEIDKTMLQSYPVFIGISLFILGFAIVYGLKMSGIL